MEDQAQKPATEVEVAQAQQQQPQGLVSLQQIIDRQSNEIGRLNSLLLVRTMELEALMNIVRALEDRVKELSTPTPNAPACSEEYEGVV